MADDEKPIIDFKTKKRVSVGERAQMVEAANIDLNVEAIVSEEEARIKLIETLVGMSHVVQQINASILINHNMIRDMDKAFKTLHSIGLYLTEEKEK